MQAIALVCPCCSCRYDQTTHNPKTIPICGHTICVTCLATILETQDEPTCPLDDTRIESPHNNAEQFETNNTILLLNAIINFHIQYGDQENEQDNQDDDQDDDEEEEDNEIDQDQQDLVIQASDKSSKTNYELIKQGELELLKIMQRRFAKLNKLLKQREQQCLSETGVHLAQERANIDLRLQKEEKLKEMCKTYIEDLGSGNMNMRFFTALEENGVQFKVKEEYQELVSRNEGLKKKVEGIMEKMDSAVSIASKFQPRAVLEEEEEERKGGEREQQRGSKMDRVRSLVRFVAKDEELLISHRNIQVKGDMGKNKVLLKQIKWEDIVKVKLDFTQRNLSEAVIEVLGYGWEELSNVSELTLNLSNSSFNDQTILSLCNNPYWVSEKMQILEINLRGCDVGDRGVKQLFEGPVKAMKGLKILKLNLKSTKIRDTTIDVLVSTLITLSSQLEAFYLYLGDTKVSNLGIQKPVEDWKPELSKLKTFYLDLRGTEVSHIGLSGFHSIISSSPLRSFTLNLFNTKVSDRDLEVFLLNRGPLCPNFSLNLTKTSITDKCLKMLAASIISQAISLENFTLNLSETRVTDEGLISLLQAIKAESNRMRSLVLTLNHTKISDISIKELIPGNPSFFSDTETFVLELSNTMITDASIVNLFTSLKVAMPCIKNFKFDLANTKVTDKSVQALTGSPLLYRNKLESCVVVLLGTKVTDSSIMALFKSLKVINLKILAIELGNSMISDKSIGSFIDHLVPFLGKLEQFTFGLSATEITDTGILNLCQAMSEKMEEIKKITIALRMTRVSSISVGVLLSYLESLKNLEEFELTVGETRVTPDVVENIRKQKRLLQLKNQLDKSC